MNNDILLLTVGWVLGLVSSLLTSFFLFWLEGKRELRNTSREQRKEDIRIARNWASDGKKVSLRGFDLQGANLSGKDLSGADLEDANFAGAQMWETDLSRANLIRANFHKTKIVKVSFRNAKLYLTDFSQANIREADFSEARLKQTKLRQVEKIQGCIWKSVEIDDLTELSLQIQREIEQQVLQDDSVDEKPHTKLPNGEK